MSASPQLLLKRKMDKTTFFTPAAETGSPEAGHSKPLLKDLDSMLLPQLPSFPHLLPMPQFLPCSHDFFGL